MIAWILMFKQLVLGAPDSTVRSTKLSDTPYYDKFVNIFIYLGYSSLAY